MTVKTFIERPILAGVISVAIVLLGFIALAKLPMEQFPDIAPPTIAVNASYTGANAETVQKSVVIPLEEAINGTEDMMYMTSSSTNTGSATIQVYFKQGADGDMAMVNVQNRIASAQGLLPAEVTQSGVTVRKRQTSQIMQFAVYSPDDSFDGTFLDNYVKINIEPRLSRIPGVGEVNVRGADYSMRIWLDPQKMSKYNLVPSDIRKVLDEQNVEAPTGTLGAESDNTFRYVLKYRGRYENETDYENMVIKSMDDGSVLRIKDVATVELGAKTYEYISRVNGHSGVTCMIAQTAGSNANDIIKEVRKTLDQLRENLPDGIEIVDLMNTKDFLDASVENVFRTLLEAILLVILVVYVFLQNGRATVIPTISIIVSLVGTFAFMYVVGYSLNLITLFALVLVIGTVVDDAIVVVEAVQVKLDEGKPPYESTVSAMSGITSALVATTSVFMAVFIPVSFFGGTTGAFYTQFGLTMAVAVAISLVNALTLSPALCALILNSKENETGKRKLVARFHLTFNAAFAAMIKKYDVALKFLFRRQWICGILIVGVLLGLFYMLKTTKTGLVPKEDMGTIYVDVQTPIGTNLTKTRDVMNQVGNCLMEIPKIAVISQVTGSGMISGQGTCNGMLILKLKPWNERKKKGDDIETIIKEIYRRTANISSANILVFTRPMISGYGVSNGFELYVQDQKDGNIEDLQKITKQFLEKLNERPEIAKATTSFDTKYPQYLVEVDAARCKKNGVSPSDVLSALSGYAGGNYASNFNRFSKLYRVMVQASPEFRLDLHSLDNLFVRNDKGEMSPLSQYITLTRVYGAQSLSRFNLFSAISVNGSAAEGYSSGEAINAIKEVAAETIPTGYGYEFGGMSREEASSGASTIFIFIVCIIFIYLILCALYESLLIPVVIILSIPFGLLGSLLFANMYGLENNIYMQVGLLMLIGLLGKTAILITEYASERRRQGMSIVQAALSAANARMRAILMTSLTMIFGMLPLMFASGVGANGNISIGVGTVGGMIIGTIALLFVVPALFIVFQKLEERLFKRKTVEK